MNCATKLKILITILLLFFIMNNISCENSKDKSKSKVEKNKPIPITIAVAEQKEVPLDLNTFGTAQAINSVTIYSQITEIIKEVHFKKGENISRGKLLFTLDSRSSEVALQQAQATLERDRIMAANARRRADRELKLQQKQLNALVDKDNAKTEADALAQAVKADEAAVAAQKINLDRCRIFSPIDGRAGAIMVVAGNLARANALPLLVINQISPADVLFSLPQAELNRIRAYNDKSELTVEATLPDDPDHTEKGKLTFINNAVDNTSGTIQLGATFENTKERLSILLT